MAQLWEDHSISSARGRRWCQGGQSVTVGWGIPPVLLLPHCALTSANMINRILTQSRHWFLVLAGQ